MRTGSHRFNFYFVAALAAALMAGCSTPTDPNEKLVTVLRVFMESKEVTALPSQQVYVYRANPVELTIEKMPLLTEADVEEARVVDQLGSYALMIRFDKRGQTLLEYNSSSEQGRRVAIYVQFGEKQKMDRWLAAPALSSKIPNGTIVFTPDATREEAYEIVTGLNNLARKEPLPLSW